MLKRLGCPGYLEDADDPVVGGDDPEQDAVVSGVLLGEQ
jgi:hypothetical protein